MDKIDHKDIDIIVADAGSGVEATIPILQRIQEKYRYLPEAALRHVCETTEITPAAIAGVSTFYSQFRHRPAGEHFIKVCVGTACHVKGADNTYRAFKQHLGIDDHDDTDADLLFTVEQVACLGCCMLAPAVQIDDVTYGFVTPNKIPGVIRDFLEGQSTTPDTRPHKQDLDMAGEVRICLCSSCIAGGSSKVHDELKAQIHSLSINAELKIVGCTGISYQTPLVELAFPDGKLFRYGRLEPASVKSLLLKHFRPTSAGRRIKASVSNAIEKLLTDEAWEPVTRYAVDVRQGPDSMYFGRQQRLATESAGELNPLDIDDYIKHGGFEALTTALSQGAQELIDQITASGLRGRGGAGFPTGQKWHYVMKEEADTKYVICNGDEGDPGAFMDRMILESFPFRVLEGMAVAAIAVGASDAYLYIRSEYPLALDRIQKAIALCEAKGFLGNNIQGSGINLKVNVAKGAGAFVCGEETALIAAIEGHRGMPRYRPPYPSTSGLWGCPTLINNVETFALTPWIIRNTPQSFSALGTEKSKGTKSFALAGKIQRGGLIEVPMGMTLREIVEDIGGGVEEGRTLKAVQVGGPSGGCIPARLIDAQVDYAHLTESGAMMGSGGMVVLDDTDCMVDIARYFMSFTQKESCGKCTFCRIGTARMLEILERLTEGKGSNRDIDLLEHLAVEIEAGSLCGLGRTAPNPVLSTLRHFRDEYEAHVNGKCPAGKCKALISYVVNDKCIGCTRCAQHCPADAIEMKPYERHEIDSDKCVRCDTCRQICPSEAIDIKSGKAEPDKSEQKQHDA
jgi:NADH-quinone oxidoreductase subunit F